MTERSPGLKALEAKYRALRKTHPVDTEEPGARKRGGGDPLKHFVEMTEEVARNYEPSPYLKTAPKK